MGLLDTDASLANLLGGGGLLDVGFKPNPNESLFTRMFGTSNPADPRSAAMMNLAAGLMRGDFASGAVGYQRAMEEGEERNARRLANRLDTARTYLGVEETRRRLQEEADSRTVMQDYWKSRANMQGQQGQAGTGMPGGAIGPVVEGGNGAALGSPGLPGTPGAVAPRSSAFDNYMGLAKAYEEKGLVKQAQQYYQLAMQFRPKYSPTPVLGRDPTTGKVGNYIVGESGESMLLPFGPKPNLRFENLGGKVQAIDENTVTGGESWDKTMTPAEAAGHQVALGNLRVSQGQLGLARDRFNLEQNTPQYMQTENGIVALPRRPQPGAQLIAQPVTGQDGQPLGPPLKSIPPSANTAILTNLQNLDRVKQALALVKGGQVGTSVGDRDATGVKGYLPNGMLNRIDPKGVDTRAAIADLGSLVIHDRSGAAVTAAESPRLLPFIPLATDDAATAEKKLQRFMQVYEAETEALQQTYSRDMGYKENPVLKRGASSAGVLPGVLPLPGELSAKNLKKGQAYMLPNGAQGVWDGMQFRTGGKE